MCTRHENVHSCSPHIEFVRCKLIYHCHEKASHARCLVNELHFAEVSWLCFRRLCRIAHSDADHWGVAFAETELRNSFRGVSEEADRAAEAYGADSEDVSREHYVLRKETAVDDREVV